MNRLTALALVLLPALAAAEPPRAAVERLLAGFEARPQPEAMRRLGPGTDAVILQIASDPATPATMRLRALAALAWVPTPAGQAACRRVIRDEAGATEGLPVLEVGACAHTLGAFGPDSAADLVPLLAHPAAEVRLGAARGLESARPASAKTAVERRLAVEPDDSVRAALARAHRALRR